MGVGGEPIEDAVLVFGRMGGVGAAMPGGLRFPELDSAVGGGERDGVARREVVVGKAVDEKDGRVRSRHGAQRRGLREIDVITGARVEKAELDSRTKQDSAEPWAGAKLLAHAIESGFAKGGEGRLGDNGTILRGGKRLEELRGSHGVADAVDAAGMLVLLKPEEPAVKVASFKHAVGGKRAVGLSVGARVGKQDCIAVAEKQVGIAKHAGAIVGLAMEKDDRVSGAGGGLKKPCLEIGSVCGAEIGLFESRVVARGKFVSRVEFGLGEAVTARMQSTFDHEDSERGAAEEPDGDGGKGHDGRTSQQRHGMGTEASAGRFHGARLR